jgi:carbonic anhydrase
VGSPHIRRTVTYAGNLVLLMFVALGTAQESHPPHWSYSGAESPAHWGSLDPEYSVCSLGHTQSPINIAHAKLADLPALMFDYKATTLNILDNGHTIQVNFAPGSTLSVGEKTYTLKQFHFHHPSEEHVNGRGFPLVAHLVHQDSAGHLAVVAILFEEGAANALINSLWSHIPANKGKAEDVPSVSVQALDLLPVERSYFTYMGSLTTPPCSEGVIWYVLKKHPTVSAQQIATFSRIYPMNARPIQPRNGRSVLESH